MTEIDQLRDFVRTAPRHAVLELPRDKALALIEEIDRLRPEVSLREPGIPPFRHA